MTMPSACTSAVRELAAAELAKGLPLCYVADLIGVDRHTLGDWMRKGEAILSGEMAPPREAGEDPPDYVAFVLAMRRARAQAVADSVAKAREGDKGHAGHMWWLERQIRDEFGPRSAVDVHHSGTVAMVVVDYSAAPIEALVERARPVIEGGVETLAIEAGNPPVRKD